MTSGPFRHCSCPDAKPDEICVRCSEPSIDGVIAAVVEQPAFQRGSVFDMDAYFAKFKRETHSIPEVM